MRDLQPWLTYSDSELDSQPMSGSGYAGTLPVDAEDDVIQRLHKAVKDVTGKAVDKPAPQRMGFL